MPRYDSLGLILTRRCRLSCFCCPVEKSARSLSRANAERALDWYFSISKGGPASIKFSGGEPFLNFPVLRRAVEYACEKHGGKVNFEVATGGGLFTGSRIAFLRRHPEIQLHLSRAERSSRLAALPNVVANVLLDPCSCADGPARVAGIFNCGFKRVNILPAYFCRWTPGQIAELEKSFALLAALFKKLSARGLRLENIKRSGAAPLFNSGATVDADGNVYTGNGVLATFMKPYRKQFCAGNIKNPDKLDFSRCAAQQQLLRRALGQRAYSDTMLVDSMLTDFVLKTEKTLKALR